MARQVFLLQKLANTTLAFISPREQYKKCGPGGSAPVSRFHRGLEQYQAIIRRNTFLVRPESVADNSDGNSRDVKQHHTMIR